MAARPLVGVHSADAKAKVAEHLPLPAVLTAPIRPDLVQDVFTRMNKNKRQAYSVSKYAGHQTSAESWGTGRAVARIPRVSGGGTHRAGQGAFGNMCRGGRMFAPTKVWRRWHVKIAVNQRRYALASALAASAVPSLVLARGHRVEKLPEVPLVVETKAFDTIDKTSKAVELLESLGAYADVERVRDSRKIRRGKGKMRNRRYVARRGPLVIYNEKNNAVRAFKNIAGVEVIAVSRLNLLQLAPGGHLGRFCIWTRDAFQQLDSLYGTYRAPSQKKAGYRLPRPIMANTDLARIINSDEVQSHLRAKKPQQKMHRHRRNALTNFGFLVKLNPYAQTLRRRELVLTQQRTAARAKQVADRRAGKNSAEAKKERAAAKKYSKANKRFHSVLTRHGDPAKVAAKAAAKPAAKPAAEKPAGK